MKRIAYLDYSRMFVVFLVVFGHMLPEKDEVLRPYIYAFHMPFFCLASGILHNYNGKVQFAKYAKTIVSPFVFFNIVFLILHPIMFKLGFGGHWSVPDVDSTDSFFYIFKSFASSRIKNVYGCFDGPTWFLLALLWCKIGLDCLMRKRRTFFLFLLYLLFCVSVRGMYYVYVKLCNYFLSFL